MAGSWKAAAASANYDDDVSEYNTLVDGAVPLIRESSVTHGASHGTSRTVQPWFAAVTPHCRRWHAVILGYTMADLPSPVYIQPITG